MKRRQYPAQPPPESTNEKAVTATTGDDNDEADEFDGDALVKGVICKVCERKF